MSTTPNMSNMTPAQKAEYEEFCRKVIGATPDEIGVIPHTPDSRTGWVHIRDIMPVPRFATTSIKPFLPLFNDQGLHYVRNLTRQQRMYMAYIILCARGLSWKEECGQLTLKEAFDVYKRNMASAEEEFRAFSDSLAKYDAAGESYFSSGFGWETLPIVAPKNDGPLFRLYFTLKGEIGTKENQGHRPLYRWDAAVIRMVLPSEYYPTPKESRRLTEEDSYEGSQLLMDYHSIIREINRIASCTKTQ